MHIRSILAIARKDALDILLNKSTLFLLLSPIFLALLFVGIGLLFGGRTTNVLLYNTGKSRVERIVKAAYPDIKITYANSSDEVTSEFGPDGTHKSSSYSLGMVVPNDFDSSLRAGGHPRLQMYVNGDQISNQQSLLLQSAITDYSRSVANPQPPASVTVATINPPKASSDVQDLNIMYVAVVLLTSLMAGTSIVPGILAEEKEKKTLRMLMVTPASFTDVVLGKLLVGLAYQLLLALLVLTIKDGFVGQVPLVLLYTLLGSCFSVAVGLLAGSIFQTTSAAGAFAGTFSFIYIVPLFFVGLFAQIFTNNPFLPFIKALPTYYIADGVSNALLNRATFDNTLLDVGVVLGSIIVLLVAASWGLHRQAAVAASI